MLALGLCGVFQAEDVIRDAKCFREFGAVYEGQSYPSFFFQAEGGIRVFCLSRGLGDVYKETGFLLLMILVKN